MGTKQVKAYAMGNRVELYRLNEGNPELMGEWIEDAVFPITSKVLIKRIEKFCAERNLTVVNVRDGRIWV